MCIDEQVEKLFDLETLKYFKNKQKGGAANQRGSRYEDFFSVMKLAESFLFLMSNDIEQDIEICTQAEAFVDDLLISDKLHKSQHHFQLKNTVNIKWGCGEKSISDDFYKQKQLNDNLGIKVTRTTLICSYQPKVATLKQEIPSCIHEFTDVLFFPKADTLNQLILHPDYSTFKTVIERICFSKDSDKVEALAKAIYGHWNDKKTTLFSVRSFLSEFQAVFPNYLAIVGVTTELLPEVVRIFDNIANFKYGIEKGYLSWSYGSGLDSGTIPYPINSETFLSFQRKVVAKHPRQFSELEGILS